MTLITFFKRSPSLYFSLVMFLATASFIAYPLIKTGSAETLFAHTSYYFFSVLFVAWIYCFHEWLQSTLASIPTYTKAAALLFAFLLALIVWSGVEHGFKVLADESNLMAISESLTFEKTAYNHTAGRWYYDNFWPITSVLDKRPILFPYLLQLVHVVLGYSISNVYILNAFFLFLFLYLIFLILYPFGGFAGGLAGMFFVLAQPILCTSAISGGFDLFSCLLQFWVTYLVLQICVKDNPNLRPLLWYSLILLVHARYENIIAFPIVLALLFLFGKFSFSELKKHPYLYSISLLFFVPRAWQFMTSQNYENPPGVPVIGWSNFVKHIPILAREFFNFKYELPYATILNVVGLGIALVWCGFFLRNRKELLPKRYMPFALVISFFAFSELTITLSHHFGVFDHPTQARLFLVFIAFLSLTPFLLRGILGFTPSKILLLSAINFFFIYFPIAQENRFVNKLTIIRKTHWTYAYFDSLDTRNILVIVDRPGIYTIRQMGAMDFNQARAQLSTIKNDLKNHLFDTAYVVEDVEYKNPKSRLSDIFKLESVFERQNTPESFVRISRVIIL
jgi:hypothetical protein